MDHKARNDCIKEIELLKVRICFCVIHLVWSSFLGSCILINAGNFFGFIIL